MTNKLITYMLAGLLLGLVIGAATAPYTRNLYVYASPYEITFERINPTDLAICRQDPNCMDIHAEDK